MTEEFNGMVTGLEEILCLATNCVHRASASVLHLEVPVAISW